MSETPPDRLSVNPQSPHYNEAVLAREVGVKFKGAEKFNVEEYCVSEGWIRVAAGPAKDRRGNPLTVLLRGPVEVWFKGGGSGRSLTHAPYWSFFTLQVLKPKMA